MTAARKLLPLIAVIVVGLACKTISAVPFPAPSEIVSSPGADQTSPASDAALSATWIAFSNVGNLWLVHPDGSGLRQVTGFTVAGPKTPTPDNVIEDFKWSPDGKMLAYLVSSTTSGNRIYLYYMETSFTHDLLSGVWANMGWSPDGTQIAYDTPPHRTHHNVNDGFWTVTVESGEKKLLLPHPTDITVPGARSGMLAPQWSPDGSYVLWSMALANGTQYGVANLGTGKSTLLPPTGLGNCEWAPRELTIACTDATGPNDPRGRVADLLVLNVAGMVLHGIKLPDTMNLPILHWSPDGTTLAIGYQDATKQAQTAIISLKSGEVRTLAPGQPWSWSPGGTRIVVAREEADQPPSLSVVDVSTGEVTSIGAGQDAAWQQ